MRPRQEANEEQIKELQWAMERETRKWFLRRLQCVWLRIKHDMTTEAVSKATGLTEGYIRKLWARYFRDGLPAIIGHPKGGRRNQYLTLQEEEEFLATHRAMAQKGWILTARKIKESYEQPIGKTVSESTVCRMLSRHHWRRVSTRPTHPKGDLNARDGFKKKLVEKVASVQLEHSGVELLVMFEDEARFGRMSRPMRCWAPLGTRPEVKTQLVRQYDYVFGAVAPLSGQMDSLILPDCDTQRMGLFLEEVSKRHPEKHILMFMDQAGWHTTGKLKIPDHMTIDHLPPRSPQCNPQEPIWRVLRRDFLGNRHFDSLDAVRSATADGLKTLENNPSFLKGLCGFDWIVSSLLNAS